MAPLPAFRRVARMQRVVSSARERDEVGSDTDPSIWDLAIEEGAEAVIGSLQFSLADDRTGQAVPTTAMELQYDREPPRMRVTW